MILNLRKAYLMTRLDSEYLKEIHIRETSSGFCLSISSFNIDNNGGHHSLKDTHN